jgi:Holliday junction resolvasome RuvABC endonuclease subunit
MQLSNVTSGSDKRMQHRSKLGGVVLGLSAYRGCVGWSLVRVGETKVTPYQAGVILTHKSDAATLEKDDVHLLPQRGRTVAGELATVLERDRVYGACMTLPEINHRSVDAFVYGRVIGAVDATLSVYRLSSLDTCSLKDATRAITGNAHSDLKEIKRACFDRFGSLVKQTDEDEDEPISSFVEQAMYSAVGAVIACLDKPICEQARRMVA